MNTPHSQSVETVLTRLKVDPTHGLSSPEVERRLVLSGPNAFERQLSRPVWRAFLAQFSSIVIWLLAAAALVSALAGSIVESIAILIVLFLNAMIGFTIEWQSGRALEALRRATPTTARTRRDGHDKTVDAA